MFVIMQNNYAHITQTYNFMPIAVSTFGEYGKGARSIIDFIGGCLSHRLRDKNAKSYFKQNLSLAIIRGNCHTLHYSLHSM